MQGPEARYTKDGKLYIRKSMIEDFNFCPLRFKKTWIDQQPRGANNIMRIGTRFHDFASKFFEYYAALPPEQWEEFIPRQFIPEEVEMASWFIDHERNRYHSLVDAGRVDEFRPVSRELRMISDALLLEGGIDRIDYWNKAKDQLCAIEYKTGYSINDESVIRQLSFYMLLWDETMHSGDIVQFQVINPRLKMVRNFEVKPWHTDKIITEIGKLRSAIKTSKYPANCSDVKYIWCQMCKSLAEAELLTEEESKETFSEMVEAESEDWRFSDIYESQSA